MICLLSLFTQFLIPASLAQETWTLAEVNDYLGKASSGRIRPAANQESLAADLEFTVEQKRQMFKPLTFTPRGQLAKLFSFDVEGFTHASGDVDFLSAKNRFYSDLDFETHRVERLIFPTD